MQDVGEARRGAAFGAILAAFDTGIGAGSTIDRLADRRGGFTAAFGAAAVLAALALPMFLLVERRFGHVAARRAGPEAVPPPGDPLYSPASFEE